MAESKKNLKIRFEGRLDNLVINYGGKILYSYKREKKRETGKTVKQREIQSRTAITAAFCSQMNKIPALKFIWRWPNIKKTPYRNMLSANMQHTDHEHLTIRNKISPRTHYFDINYFKSIDMRGLELVKGSSQVGTIETETGKTFSVVAIICLFNPFDKTKKSYKLYSFSKELQNFQITETYKIRFPFEAATQEDLGEYGNCIVYDCVLFSRLEGGAHKWITTTAVELELKLEK